MVNLPRHGRVACTKCFRDRSVIFDQTERQEGYWRITSNPLAWGNQNPEVIILGFSKGPNQKGALATSPHDLIAFKGSRLNVGKILAHIGLLPQVGAEELRSLVDRIIADPSGRFHFGSLIRCTVERYDQKEELWKGSGGGMLERFIATEFGGEVAMNCSRQFLGQLPPRTKLIVLFGLGTKLNYVSAAKNVIEQVRNAHFTFINDVAYTDGKITVIHVEHFASQGALLPNWLGENKHERERLGLMAKDAVPSELRVE